MTRIAPALHHLLTTIILLDFFTLTVWPWNICHGILLQ